MITKTVAAVKTLFNELFYSKKKQQWVCNEVIGLRLVRHSGLTSAIRFLGGGRPSSKGFEGEHFMGLRKSPST